MRRKDREIVGFEQILAVMEQCAVCHVAFQGETYPYVVPMNFGLDVAGETVSLYFHGAQSGKKHDLLRRCNRVSFVMEHTHPIVTGPQVGACEATMEYESVMGTGILEYVSETEKVRGLETILAHYHVAEGERYHFHQEVVPRVAVLRLRVEQLTAKRRQVGRP